MYPKVQIKNIQFSEEEFFQFCQDNETLKIERNENQQIVIMPPTSPVSGNFNSEIVYQLKDWGRKQKIDGVFGDSSSGYKLSDGSVRSPDASWVSVEAWSVIPKELQKRFPPICPEFVVELLSESDSLEELKKKMQFTWIANGAKLAWLIDPKSKQTFIYRANGSIEIVEGFNKKLSGENVLEGFEFDLSWLKEI